MNRKEFNLIAETIRSVPSFKYPGNYVVVRFDVLVSRFATALAATNPRFNRERFIEACTGKQDN